MKQKKKSATTELIPQETIERKILLLRGKKVMLDRDLADSLRFQFGSLKRGQHAKYLPRAFTEQGVAMLSSVLNSKRAILVNIQIMRAFTVTKTPQNRQKQQIYVVEMWWNAHFENKI